MALIRLHSVLVLVQLRSMSALRTSGAVLCAHFKVLSNATAAFLTLQAETYGTCFIHYYFNIMFNQSMRYVHDDAVLSACCPTCYYTMGSCRDVSGYHYQDIMVTITAATTKAAA
eukprot:10820-Heterococcus_DN1.PRE.6